MTKDSNILVTGGLGFIGSNLVDFLFDHGYSNITVVDNLSSESSSMAYQRVGVNYYIEDARNIEKYCHTEFDIIFHLAADARIQPSFADPEKTIDNNLMATVKICALARKHGAKLIYAGSSTFYSGVYSNPYTFSKWFGECAVLMYHKIYNIEYNIARFFNVYGNRQPKKGAFATVIGIFENCYLQQKELPVTGDGTQRRDFTHIDDIVSGLIAMAGSNCMGVYSLGTGVNYSIAEVAKMFSKKIKYIAKRPGEAQDSLADISDAKKYFEWVPEVSLKDYVDKFISTNLIN